MYSYFLRNTFICLQNFSGYKIKNNTGALVDGNWETWRGIEGRLLGGVLYILK
jgi:hypothetical protein